MDSVTKMIIDKVSTMNEEQRAEYLRAVKEVIILPGLDSYLSSNASATFKS